MSITGNVGHVPMVVPPGGTARFKVTLKGGFANRLLITDGDKKPLKQFDHTGGTPSTSGSYQVDAPTSHPVQLLMFGSHKEPGEDRYVNDKWTTILNEPTHKLFGWEDFGDSDFRDILVDVEVDFGTR